VKDIIRLQEVGRVLSSKNEKVLRAAVETINGILNQLQSQDVTEEQAVEQVQQVLKEAAAEMSFDEKRALVSGAVREKYGTRMADGTPTGAYLENIYDDYAVYRMDSDGSTWKVGYVITDGKVTLGDTQKVVRVETYEVAEAGRPGDLLTEGDVIPLVEAVKPDGTIKIRIAKPGWGTSGYYSAKLLAEQGPKAFPKGTKMYWDHPTEREDKERPERSLRDLAAEQVTPAEYLSNGPVGPGLYAEAKVFKPYREAVEELAPHIGTSLRAYGKAKQGSMEGRKGPIVEAFIGEASSVDFVTSAGAGGEILQLFEAKRGQNTGTQEVDDEVSQEELAEAKRLQEAAERERDESRAQARRLTEAMAVRDAVDLAQGILAKATKLPDITKSRLLESVPRLVAVKDDGTLDKGKFEEGFAAVVKSELDYITALTGTKRTAPVTGMGTTLSESLHSTPVEDDKFDDELTGLFQSMGLSESLAKKATAGRN
jgi:hypothetical protein